MTLAIRGKNTRFWLGLFALLAAVLLIASFANGGVREALWVSPVVIAIVALAWAFFWNPRVEVSPDGIRVVNLVREYKVPWADFLETVRRWGLLINTHSNRSISAWAVPSSQGLFSNSWIDSKKAPEAEVEWAGEGYRSVFQSLARAGDTIDLRKSQIDRDPKLRVPSAWGTTTVSAPLPVTIVVILAALAAIIGRIVWM